MDSTNTPLVLLVNVRHMVMSLRGQPQGQRLLGAVLRLVMVSPTTHVQDFFAGFIEKSVHPGSTSSVPLLRLVMVSPCAPASSQGSRSRSLLLISITWLTRKVEPSPGQRLLGAFLWPVMHCLQLLAAGYGGTAYRFVES